jgi:hypothetical protein
MGLKLAYFKTLIRNVHFMKKHRPEKLKSNGTLEKAIANNSKSAT